MRGTIALSRSFHMPPKVTQMTRGGVDSQITSFGHLQQMDSIFTKSPGQVTLIVRKPAREVVALPSNPST